MSLGPAGMEIQMSSVFRFADPRFQDVMSNRACGGGRDKGYLGS